MTKPKLEDLFKKNESQLPKVITKMEETPEELPSLLTIIERSLTPKQLQALKAIGLAVGQAGLPLGDACLLNRVTQQELDNLIIYVPEIKTYLRLKQIEYKYKLLQVVTKQATENGDVKIATWLLEKQFAEEYDSSMKKDMMKMQQNENGDIMEMAIAYVRRASSNTMPVHEHAGAEEDRAALKVYDMKEVLS